MVDETLEIALEDALDTVTERGIVLSFDGASKPMPWAAYDQGSKQLMGLGESMEGVLNSVLGRPVKNKRNEEFRYDVRQAYGKLHVLVSLWTEMGYVPNRPDSLYPPLEDLQDVLMDFHNALEKSRNGIAK